MPSHPLLHRDRAGDGFDNAREFDQDAVAGGLDDAALVLGDIGIDQLAAQRLEARQGAGLVLAHQPAIPRDIGREDGREPALDPLCAQGTLRKAACAGRKPRVDSLLHCAPWVDTDQRLAIADFV